MPSEGGGREWKPDSGSGMSCPLWEVTYNPLACLVNWMDEDLISSSGE